MSKTRRRDKHTAEVAAAAASLALIIGRTQRAMRTTISVSINPIVNAGLSTAMAAAVIGANQTRVITRARQTAREYGARAFEGTTGLDRAVEPEDREGLDTVHADKAGALIAARWAAGVAEKEAAKDVAAVSRRTLLRSVDIDASIDRVGSWEVAKAFNEENRRNASAYLARGLRFAHEWNAQADACDVCANYDGTIVHGDEGFADGDPPLHAHCACRIDTFLEN